MQGYYANSAAMNMSHHIFENTQTQALEGSVGQRVGCTQLEQTSPRLPTVDSTTCPPAGCEFQLLLALLTLAIVSLLHFNFLVVSDVGNSLSS